MVRQKLINRAIASIALMVMALSAQSSGGQVHVDRLVVLTSHRPELLEEISQAFRTQYRKEHKRDIVIDWIDQGGSYRNSNYAMQIAASKDKLSTVDVFWGGGIAPYQKLSKLGVFEKLQLDAATKKSIAQLKVPVDRRHANDWSWVVSSLSGVGLFVNQSIVPFPNIFRKDDSADLSRLADPIFRDKLIALDPRASSSFAFVCQTIINQYGWQQGLKILTGIFINSRKIERRGNSAIEAVAEGSAGVTVGIDYLAYLKVHAAKATDLKFAPISDVDQLGSDPIALMRRGANQQSARRFIQFVLSPTAQRILQWKKGQNGGPQQHSIGRIAMRVEVFNGAELANPINPFVSVKSPGRLTAKNLGAGVSEEVLAAYIGAVFVDQHARWRSLSSSQTIEVLGRIDQLTLSNSEIKMLSDVWQSPTKNALLLSMAQKRMDAVLKLKK